LSLSLTLGAVPLARAATPPAMPNIIFILADDLGYGDVGAFYQNSRPASKPRMATPQLDTMAAQGMMFRQHYTGSPVCAPARASLLLGQHQGNCSIRDNEFDKALPNNHTLATVLKQAGYYCGAIGKWGLAGQTNFPAVYAPGAVSGYPLQHGFDEFFGFVDHASGHVYYHNVAHPLYQDYTNVTTSYSNIYSTDLFFARAKKFVTDRLAVNPAQPFFLYLAPTAVHAAIQVPGGPFPPGTGTKGGLRWPLTPTPETADTWIHPDYTNATSSGTNWTAAMKRYATDDRRLDDAVGDLLQLLRDLGIATNTLVVFSSDNGPANESDGGAYGSDPRYFDSWAFMDGIKRDLWEAGVREPTVAWWPGKVPAGVTNDLISAFWDWMPTFADLAGLAPPAQADGVSLLPALTGQGAQRGRGFLYFEYYYNGTFPVDGGTAGLSARKGVTSRNQLQSVRSGDFVAVRYNITSATDPFRLYNVVTDPHEDSNLAGYATNAAMLATLSNLTAQVRMPELNASDPRPYDSQLVPPTNSVATTNGLLDYALFGGVWPWVPDFDALTAVSTGKVAALNLSFVGATNNLGLSFKGFVTVPADGPYTFYLTDDSGAQMWIHECHVLDDDFNHTGAEVSGTIPLKAGLHPFRLFYRHATGPLSLALQYSGPGIAKQSVPVSSFSSACNCVQPVTARDDSASTPQATPVTIDVLANDLPGTPGLGLTLLSVAVPQAGVAAISNNQVVYTPGASFLGDDSFTYLVTDGSATNGATVRVSVYFSDGSLWFPFDQTGGLTTEEAGGAYTASLIGFANDPAQWVAGKWNKALQFDGVSNRVVVTGYPGILGVSNRTVAAWIKTTNTGTLFYWGVPSNNGQKWAVRVQNSNGTFGALRAECQGGYIVGDTDLRDGLWHHIACVFTNNSTSITNVKLYVDGVLEGVSAQKDMAINTVANGDALIGCDNTPLYFSGVMDEVRIYNRALSAGDVSSLVTATNQSAAAWYRRYFGDAPINWYVDDDNGAGVCLLEYALGGQPWIPDRPQMSLQAAIVGNHIQVRFPRRLAGTAELIYRVQVSPDLRDWTTLTSSEVGTAPLASQPGFEQAIFQADAALNQYSPLFLRLQVGFQ
jgi:arylsulfatase A-like enzyme